MTDMVARIETIENGLDNHSRGYRETYSVWPKPPRRIEVIVGSDHKQLATSAA